MVSRITTFAPSGAMPPPVESRPCIELSLIEEQADVKKLEHSLMTSVTQSLKRENLSSQLKLQEQLAALQAQAEASRCQKGWNFLSLISASVFGVLTVAAGVATGNRYLAASGSASLANALITHCEGWDAIATTLACGNEEARVAVRQFVPLALTLASGAMGYVGATAHQNMPEALVALQKLQAYASGGIGIGEAYSTYQKGRLDVELLESEQHLSLHNRKLEALYREIRSLTGVFRQISSSSKQSVQQAIRATVAVAGGV